MKVFINHELSPQMEELLKGHKITVFTRILYNKELYKVVEITVEDGEAYIYMGRQDIDMIHIGGES